MSLKENVGFRGNFEGYSCLEIGSQTWASTLLENSRRQSKTLNIKVCWKSYWPLTMFCQDQNLTNSVGTRVASIRMDQIHWRKCTIINFHYLLTDFMIESKSFNLRVWYGIWYLSKSVSEFSCVLLL